MLTNFINKKIELLTNISTGNPDIICVTETLPRYTHLPINECELQVHDYDCFSNSHSGVVISVEKYLNATSFCIN